MGLDQSRKMLFSKAEDCGPHDQISLKYQKYELLFQKCQQEQNISEKFQKFTQQLWGIYPYLSSWDPHRCLPLSSLWTP